MTGDAFGGAVGFLDINDALIVAGAGGGTGVADLYAQGVPLSVSAATTYTAGGSGETADSVIFSGTFEEIDLAFPVTVTINWGDGSAPTVETLPAGSSAFAVPHAYASAGNVRDPGDAGRCHVDELDRTGRSRRPCDCGHRAAAARHRGPGGLAVAWHGRSARHRHRHADRRPTPWPPRS